MNGTSRIVSESWPASLAAAADVEMLRNPEAISAVAARATAGGPNLT
jgi:hypothetical protein